MTKIGVVSIGIGNVGSLLRRLKEIGCVAFEVSSYDELKGIDGIILSGIGAFQSAMSLLPKICNL